MQQSGAEDTGSISIGANFFAMMARKFPPTEMLPASSAPLCCMKCSSIRGLFLLFGGILIGYVGRMQGKTVTDVDDPVFVALFQGFLCLFLLEMGMTASRRLKDLKTAGWKFIAFASIMPNVFATIGMIVAHCYSHVIGEPFELGTYCALCSVVRPRRPTSPCQPCSGWRFPRPAPRCRWPHHWDARSLIM